MIIFALQAFSDCVTLAFMTKMNIQYTHYRVGRATAGLGLFARENLRKGSFIIEYTGEQISHKEADKKGGRYLFTLNDQWVIDGTGRKNQARYLNHSCAPNCEAIIEDDAHIMIYALTDISKGDELTYDYGKEYFDDIIGGRHHCRCRTCTS